MDVGRTIDLARSTTHRGQRSIFTLIANSGSLHKFGNSCTARIYSLHDFQTILNAKAYACRGPLHVLRRKSYFVEGAPSLATFWTKELPWRNEGAPSVQRRSSLDMFWTKELPRRPQHAEGAPSTPKELLRPKSRQRGSSLDECHFLIVFS